MALSIVTTKLYNLPDAIYGVRSITSVLLTILVINTYLLHCVQGNSFSNSENYGSRQNRDLNIKTLPPDPSYSSVYSHDHQQTGDYYSSNDVINSADALLSNWDGDHWASLDADQDMVNLQWSSNSEEITFQVRIDSFSRYFFKLVTILYTDLLLFYHRFLFSISYCVHQ